jgi:hypothetical protein
MAQVCLFLPRGLRPGNPAPLPETNPTGSQVTPAISALVPRLPPCQPLHHLSQSKRGDVSPTAPHRSFARSTVSRHVQGVCGDTLSMGQTGAARDRRKVRHFILQIQRHFISGMTRVR